MRRLFVLHLASFSSLNLYLYRRGPYICEFHAKWIMKKLNIRVFYQKKWANASGCLWILRWILCLVTSCVQSFKPQKGSPCHVALSAFFLVPSTLRFCMGLKHSLQKVNCPDFEFLGDGVAVWETVLVFNHCYYISFHHLSIVSSSFQQLNERSCMYLELETCSHMAVGLIPVIFFGSLNSLISLHLCQVTVLCIFNQLVLLFILYPQVSPQNTNFT